MMEFFVLILEKLFHFQNNRITTDQDNIHRSPSVAKKENSSPLEKSLHLNDKMNPPSEKTIYL